MVVFIFVDRNEAALKIAESNKIVYVVYNDIIKTVRLSLKFYSDTLALNCL